MTYGIQEVCTNNRLKLVLSVGCSIIAVGSSDDGDESAGVAIAAVVSMYKLLRMKSKNADSDAETEVDAVSVSNTSNNNQSMNSSQT